MAQTQRAHPPVDNYSNHAFNTTTQTKGNIVSVLSTFTP